jgi:hypothetical protein
MADGDYIIGPGGEKLVFLAEIFYTYKSGKRENNRPFGGLV